MSESHIDHEVLKVSTSDGSSISEVLSSNTVGQYKMLLCVNSQQ